MVSLVLLQQASQAIDIGWLFCNNSNSRLHCYLPTVFQKPNRDSIYTLNLNGLPLQDTFWVEDVPEVATSSTRDRKQNKDDNNKIKQLNALMELLSDMKSDVVNVGSNPIKIVEECTANLKKSLGK